MKIKFEWECIYTKVGENKVAGIVTNRAKVLGGWMVRTITWSGTEVHCSESSVFVPDPTHLWEIEES